MTRIYYTKPSITELEIRYAADAAANGWGDRCYDYITRFEDTFKQHLGVKHAIATSSCTGALHIGLAALGIAPEMKSFWRTLTGLLPPRPSPILEPNRFSWTFWMIPGALIPKKRKRPLPRVQKRLLLYIFIAIFVTWMLYSTSGGGIIYPSSKMLRKPLARNGIESLQVQPVFSAFSPFTAQRQSQPVKAACLSPTMTRSIIKCLP